MSNRSLIVVLLTALVLAIGLIITQTGGSAAGHASRDGSTPGSGQDASPSQSLADLLGLAEGEVAGLRVWRGAQRERVVTDGSQWHYAQGDDPEIQPVDESRVRAFLQFLRQSQVTASSSTPSTENAMTLAIELKKADRSLQTVQIIMATTALNGRVVAAIKDCSISVSGDLLKLLTEPGLSAWRSSKAMPTITQASSVSIDRSGERVYAFGGSKAGWMLDEPVSVLADGNLIAAILKQLDSITVQRYLGVNQVPPGVDASKVPAAAVEWKIGDGEGMTYRIELFAPANAAGDIFFARVRRMIFEDKAPHYWCSVDAKPLSPVLVDPSGLALPRLSQLNPADIGGFRINRGDRSLTYTREGSTWREKLDAGEAITLGPKESAEALGFVDLLTSPKATSVNLKSGQSMIMGSESFLELLSSSGTVLESHALSITVPEGGKGPSQLRLRKTIEFVYAPVPGVIQTAIDRLKP